MALGGEGEPANVDVVRMTPSAFGTLGVSAHLGRTFAAEEGEPGGPAVVLVSHGFWRQRLGGDPAAVGTLVTLNDERHRVVGVLPPGFDFPSPEVDIWRPLRFGPEDRVTRQAHQWNVVGRLAGGATLASARDEMDGIARRIAERHPEHMTDWGVSVVPLRRDLVGEARAPHPVRRRRAGAARRLRQPRQPPAGPGAGPRARARRPPGSGSGPCAARAAAPFREPRARRRRRRAGPGRGRPHARGAGGGLARRPPAPEPRGDRPCRSRLHRRNHPGGHPLVRSAARLEGGRRGSPPWTRRQRRARGRREPRAPSRRPAGRPGGAHAGAPRGGRAPDPQLPRAAPGRSRVRTRRTPSPWICRLPATTSPRSTSASSRRSSTASGADPASPGRRARTSRR